MRLFSLIDNIKRANNSIWSVAKLLGDSRGEIDSTELEGITDAILEQSKAIEKYCFALLPDEDDTKQETEKKLQEATFIIDQLNKALQPNKW